MLLRELKKLQRRKNSDQEEEQVQSSTSPNIIETYQNIHTETGNGEIFNIEMVYTKLM